MEGHPWWPALVCNHPKEGITRHCNLLIILLFEVRVETRILFLIITKTPNKEKIWRKKGGLLFHVQFVESTPSRGWIKEKLVGLIHACGFFPSI